MQQQLFETIFSDALIIDIDMSRWDNLIRIAVIADHVDSAIPGRLPWFAVDFVHVHQWNMEFDRTAPGYRFVKPGEHIQWRPYQYNLTVDSDSRYVITLWGSEATPRLHIICEDVHIAEQSYTGLDRAFPGWSKPGRGFVRPSIDVWTRRLVFGENDGAK